MSALLRVPVQCHQLPGVRPSLEKPAVRRAVTGMTTNDAPMSWICVGSASSWDTESLDMQPDLVQDSTARLRASTLRAMHTDEDAGLSPKGVYEHMQCLIDGFLDDLTPELCAHAKPGQMSSLAESTTLNTSILPHCIDTDNNVPHFEQLWHHPIMRLPLNDEHMEKML